MGTMSQMNWPVTSLPTTPKLSGGAGGILAPSNVTGGITPGVKNSLLDKLGGLGGGGSFTALGSLFGPWGTAVGGAADIATQIAGLFKKSPAGLQKITATKNQQDIEASALDIQKRVQEGGLDPGTALQQLNNLLQLVTSGGGTNVDETRGMQKALLTINNVIGNVKEAQNWQLTKTPDRAGGAGLAAVSPDPSTQQSYVKNLLMNKLAGFQRGDEGIAGSPLEGLFAKSKPVGEGFQEQLGIAKGGIPDFQPNPRYEELRKRLEGMYGKQ